MRRGALRTFKAQRIRTLQEVGESKVGEGIRPELIGIVNYAGMALVQIKLGVVDTPDLSPEQAKAAMLAEFNGVRELCLLYTSDAADE